MEPNMTDIMIEAKKVALVYLSTLMVLDMKVWFSAKLE
jgi:hypothetical protein